MTSGISSVQPTGIDAFSQHINRLIEVLSREDMGLRRDVESLFARFLLPSAMVFPEVRGDFVEDGEGVGTLSREAAREALCQFYQSGVHHREGEVDGPEVAFLHWTLSWFEDFPGDNDCSGGAV